MAVLVAEVLDDQVVGQILDGVDVRRHVDRKFDGRTVVFKQDVLVVEDEVVDDDAEKLQHVVEHVLSEKDLVAFGQNLDHE